VKFLVDNQLPPALARMIVTELKAEAVYVSDVGLRDARDAALWNYLTRVPTLGPAWQLP
jgi:predicted nuclease of predicted toxin-antitoxin system